MKRTAKRLNTDNTDNFINSGVNVDDRIIHLFTDIDPESAGVVIKGIQLMMAKTLEKPIDIYINSTGGDPYSSIGLYDFIHSLSGVVINTYNIGCAMSGASIIFLAGDNRYMYENCVFMFHSVSSSAKGKVFLDLVDEAEECKRIHKQLCAIYAKHTNKTEKQWDHLIKTNDRFYRAVMAKEIGIVHKVIVDNSDKAL